MIRKIYLEGELGHKFGPAFDFSGDSVADALRCVDVNTEGFRKYLMEAHEADIGFTIQVQGVDIEDIRPCRRLRPQALKTYSHHCNQQTPFYSCSYHHNLLI